MAGRALAVLFCGLSTASGPAAAQIAEPPFGPNFLSFRYASRTSLSLYAAYGQGNLLLFAGMVQNPRSGYRETAGGVGLNVRLGSGASAVVATAVASAIDSWYTQLYLLPDLTAGHLSVNGMLEVYEPLERAGARQFDVNPCSLFWRLSDRLQLGTAYLLYTQVGAAPRQEAGPTVRVTVPHGNLTAEFFRPIGGRETDVRLTFQAAL
jgi:hypothetical protein